MAACSGSSQVVRLLVGAVAASAVSIKEVLDLLEGFPIDDRLMASLALDATSGDDPGVVVAKHPVNHAARKWANRPFEVPRVRSPSSSMISV
jgi:hypothetical protein